MAVTPNADFAAQQRAKRAAWSFQTPVLVQPTAAGGDLSATATPLTSTVNQPSAPVSVAPAPVSVAPAPVQAPVAPAPKVAPKPVAKATEPVINYNSSVGREGEISTNLTNITTQDPNLTKDRGLFDQAFGYSTADSGKKAILDSFFQSKTVDQPRMDALKGLIGASETQLYDAMTGGTLTPGGEKWNDLIKANGWVETPEMMVAKQKNEMRMKVEAINKNTTALIGTTQEEVSVSQKLSDLIVRNNGIDYATEFQNKVINNPALVKLNDTVNATAFRIKELRDQKARAYKDIIKQYPGITHGAAILLANQQNDAVDQELNQLQNQQSVDTSNLQYQTGLLEKGFGLEYDQTRTQTSQAFEILKTVQGQQFQSSETQAGRDFQTSQFELQQSYANPDINSQDPNIARIAANKAIDQELKFARDNGIPVIRGQSQIIADAQAYAKKNGVSLSQAIQDTFTVPFQSKTEYKQALSNTQASRAPKDADKYEYRTEEDAAGNKGTAVYKDGVKISGAWIGVTWADLYKRMTASSNPIGVYATGDMSGERHAQFYREAEQMGLEAYINKFKGTQITADMVNQSAQQFGVDPLMIAATMGMDSSMGTKGKGARNNNPGNVGQFDSLDAQGITVKGYATLQEGIDAVSINLAKRQKALGMVSKWVETQAGAQGYSESDIEILSTLANMDDSARNTALKAQGIPLKAVTDYMALAKAGKIPTTQAQKNSSLDMMNIIQDISTTDWKNATGFQIFETPIRWTDRATATAKIENLIAQMVLPNLGMLKWPMSDKDIVFLKAASSKFDLTQSDTSFEKNLIEFYNILARKAGNGEIKGLGDIPKERIQSWIGSGSTGSGIWPSSQRVTNAMEIYKKLKANQQ